MSIRPFYGSSRSPRLLSSNTYIRTLLSVFLLSAIAAPTAQAKDRDLDQILDKLQSAYDNVNSYRATFRQRTGTPASSGTQETAGIVTFLKPGKMRWDYDKPKRSFVSDGTTFWMVQHDRKEVVQAPVKAMFGDTTPMAFLSGFGEVRKSFNATLQGREKGIATVKLDLKKPTTQAQYLIVQIDEKSGLAKSVKTVDFFQAYNELNFSKYQLNKKFGGDHFSVKIPTDYKIVEPTKNAPPQKKK